MRARARAWSCSVRIGLTRDALIVGNQDTPQAIVELARMEEYQKGWMRGEPALPRTFRPLPASCARRSITTRRAMWSKRRALEIAKQLEM